MEGKNWLKSMTIWGGLIIGLQLVAKKAGYHFETSGLEAAVEDLLDLVAAMMVIWGRARADRPVKFKLPTK